MKFVEELVTGRHIALKVRDIFDCLRRSEMDFIYDEHL